MQKSDQSKIAAVQAKQHERVVLNRFAALAVAFEPDEDAARTNKLPKLAIDQIKDVARRAAAIYEAAMSEVVIREMTRLSCQGMTAADLAIALMGIDGALEIASKSPAVNFKHKEKP
jgi:hypothetical protein